MKNPNPARKHSWKSLFWSIAWKVKKFGRVAGKLLRKIITRKNLQRLVIFLVIFAGATAVFFYFYIREISKSLPDPNQLITRPYLKSTIIYDRNGQELYRFYKDVNREFVGYDKIPDYVKWSVIAAEDSKFYEHQGVDYLAISRCIVTNLLHAASNDSNFCGASTISQQLVRNTILYDTYAGGAFERKDLLATLDRKMKEIVLTLEVERNFSKKEILQLYINEVPLGGVNYGFQAAAQSYFRKDLKDLTLGESALLAGLIQSPSNYNPFSGNPAKALARQQYVLNQLAKLGQKTGFTEQEMADARNEQIVFADEGINIKAPHFVFYIKDLLLKKFSEEDLYKNGYKIYTSLDLQTQEIAEDEIKTGIAQYGKQWGVENGALVAIDPQTNQILAMVGSVDYNARSQKVTGNVNVTTSLRQMGSSVKPYTYLALIHQGYNLGMVAPDIPQLPYGVENFDFQDQGLVTARQALVQSRNISAVYVMETIGVQSFVDTVKKLGITTIASASPKDLTITLGTKEMTLLEHTSAMSIFPGEGLRKPLTPILKITDSDGKVLEDNSNLPAERIFPADEIYMMNWAMCDLGQFDDYDYANPPYNYHSINGQKVLCGKTGTTDGPRDLLSIEYHKNLIVGVWAGNNDNSPAPGAWSYNVSLPISHSFLEKVSGIYPPGSFSKPDTVADGTVCKDTGKAPNNIPCPRENTVYLKSRPLQKDQRNYLTVCRQNNLIPSNESAKYVNSLFYLQPYLNGKIENSKRQAAYDNYVATVNGANGLKMTNILPGTAECPLPEGYVWDPVTKSLYNIENRKLMITFPTYNQTLGAGGTIRISILVSRPEKYKKLEIFYDNQLFTTISPVTGAIAYNYTIPSAPAGQTAHIIAAKLYDSTNNPAETSVMIYVQN